jgi:hypothetical protein
VCWMTRGRVILHTLELCDHGPRLQFVTVAVNAVYDRMIRQVSIRFEPDGNGRNIVGALTIEGGCGQTLQDGIKVG